MIKRYKHQPLLGYVKVDNISDHRGLVCDSAQVREIECKLEESVILCAEMNVKNIDQMLRIDKLEDDLVTAKSELHSACEELEKAENEVVIIPPAIAKAIYAKCTKQEFESVWDKTKYMETHKMPLDDMEYVGLDRGLLWPLNDKPNGIDEVTIDELVAEAGK